MALTNMLSFIPSSAAGATTQLNNLGLWNAQQRFHHSDRLLQQAGGYIGIDPAPYLDAGRGFVIDEARQGWNDLRDTFGAGVMLINSITRIVQSPCRDKWRVLVETALPAAGDALWLLIVPSPGEILENYLEPGGRGGGKRRTNDSDPRDRRRANSGRLLRSWPGFPDVDRMIADLIPGRDAARGRNAGAPTRWLFDAINRADRVGWWFLVLDATDTFITSWTSGLMEARFCTEDFDALLNLSFVGEDGGGDLALWRPLEDVDIADADGWEVQNNGDVRRTLFNTGASGTLSVTMSVDIVANEGTAIFDVSVRLNWFDTNGQLHIVQGPKSRLFGSGTIEAGLSEDLVNAEEIAFVRRVDVVEGFVVSSTWQGEVAGFFTLDE